jgi:hypothetical protein
MATSNFLNKNFLSLHGRLLGLFRGVLTVGDAYLGGDGFMSILEAATDTITAKAGGGQSAATPLTTPLNRITIVASANDSVTLPLSQPGMTFTVTNAAAANSLNVFPNTGEIINALGANAAFALVANKTATFTCYTAGQWHTVLSA